MTASLTQIVEVSNLSQLVTACSAIDQGVLDDGHAPRRVLVVTNNAIVPEAAADLREAPAFAALATRFDDVRSWNETIAPLHPSQWRPDESETPMWERFLRLAWELGDGPVDLVVESVQVPPSLSLVLCFPQARVSVYADGLMSWGPTRMRLPAHVLSRVHRLVHPDLVPGVEPLLLRETDATRICLDTTRHRALVDSLGADVELPSAPGAGPLALLLGQYLSPLGLLTSEEETRLHADFVDAAVARGCRRLVFKPHPTAPAELTDGLLARAAALGAEVTVWNAPIAAETVLSRLAPDLVVGCFSTGLVTARELWGVPAVSVGASDLLARLRPWANSNRIPLTILAATAEGPADAPRPAPADLAALLEVVGYTMQPETLAPVRHRVEAWLAAHDPAGAWLSPTRLGELGLPGGVITPRQRAIRLARTRARSAYRFERRLEDRLKRAIKGS